jgi:hypothetical protein
MEIINKSFREFKARKAKYGFSSSLCLRTTHSVAMAMDVMSRFDPEAIMDERTGGMYPEVNFYTNNEQAAEAFRAECVEKR